MPPMPSASIRMRSATASCMAQVLSRGGGAPRGGDRVRAPRAPRPASDDVDRGRGRGAARRGPAGDGRRRRPARRAHRARERAGAAGSVAGAGPDRRRARGAPGRDRWRSSCCPGIPAHVRRSRTPSGWPTPTPRHSPSFARCASELDGSARDRVYDQGASAVSIARRVGRSRARDDRTALRACVRSGMAAGGAVKVGILREHRLGAALEAAMRNREADAIALTADRTKAMAVALAGMSDDSEVEPPRSSCRRDRRPSSSASIPSMCGGSSAAGGSARVASAVTIACSSTTCGR